MKMILAILLCAVSAAQTVCSKTPDDRCDTSGITIKSVQLVFDPVQAARQDHPVKPCGPDNHDPDCVDPTMRHITNRTYSVKSACEQAEGVSCTSTNGIQDRWVPIGKPVFYDETPAQTPKAPTSIPMLMDGYPPTTTIGSFVVGENLSGTLVTCASVNGKPANCVLAQGHTWDEVMAFMVKYVQDEGDRQYLGHLENDQEVLRAISADLKAVQQDLAPILKPHKKPVPTPSTGESKP